MSTSDYVALASLFVSMVAFIISILDWLQIGREEPWSAEWASKEAFILKRHHYWPVWVENVHNFHGGNVKVLNDAASIPWPMHRNSQQAIQVEPIIEGTFLTVCYRKLSILELLRFKLADFVKYFSQNPLPKPFRNLGKVQKKLRPQAGKYWNSATLQGKHNWVTPVVER